MTFPIYGKNKIHVPNHQPDDVLCRAWEASTLADLGTLHFHLTIGRHGIFLNKPKQ